MDYLRRVAKYWFAPRPSIKRGDDVGLYYYIRCKRCNEVIQVRVNPMNDLSHNDDNSQMFAHKTIVGQKCYNRIEADFTYDNKRKLISSEINGGTLVTADDYEEYRKQLPEK